MREYSYKAEVVRWVDGDTVWISVDCGLRISTLTDFRLYGVDTPERGQPGYQEATAFVRKLAPTGTTVDIHTYKDPDKYGRWLADVSVNGDVPINVQLIQNGLAKAYFGGKK